MKYLKYILVALIIFSLVAFPVYYFFSTPAIAFDELFETEKPKEKTIKQVISATGKLKVKDQINIGSLVTGQVKAIFVEENDKVNKGQLLMEIDTGLGDTELRAAEGAYEKALAELDFYDAQYKRKQQLHYEQFISESELEEAKKDYLTTLAEVKSLKADYDKELISCQNCKVYSPCDGIVIHIVVSKGDKVTSDIDEGKLLTLVPDIEKIEAELEISEKDIGQVSKGQPVQMIVDTYPNRTFNSVINNVSFVAVEDDDDGCIYLSKAYIDNPQLLLRPGMNVTASIDAASVKSALSVTSRAFLIREEHLKPIADLLSYDIDPLDAEEKDDLKESKEGKIEFIWIVEKNRFKEIPVEVGITDHFCYEIKSGLNGDEECVVEVLEDDEMKKIYEKAFRKI